MSRTRAPTRRFSNIVHAGEADSRRWLVLATICFAALMIVLMPQFGPKPLVILGLLSNAVGMAWLTRIGVHSGYASALLGPLVATGFGSGLIFSAGPTPVPSAWRHATRE